MRRIVARLLLSGLALASVGIAPMHAQPLVRQYTPPGQRSNVYLPAVSVSRLEWKRRDDKPFMAFLFLDDRLAGCLDVEHNAWWPYDPDAKKYGDPQPLFPLAK